MIAAARRASVYHHLASYAVYLNGIPWRFFGWMYCNFAEFIVNIIRIARCLCGS